MIGASEGTPDHSESPVLNPALFYPAETRFLETGRSEKFAFDVLSGGVAFFNTRPCLAKSR
jgi:hypothetical protein